jgi:alpha-mannosidase
MRNTIIALTLILLSGRAVGVAAVTPAENPAGAGKAYQRYLYLVATAHLDTQWRWTIRETIEEFILKTFRVNATHFENFEDYVFSFEGAFRYMLLREYFPDDYERLKGYIADGRWQVAGSWVDAVDVNVPSPESLIRHALYGNGYFKKEFGKSSTDIYLPDCFGFGYALPSIAAHCGLDFFSTQKLTWGSSVGVPFDIGVWRGVDGSELTAALNPGAYVSKVRGDLSSDSVWVDTIERQGETSGLYAGFKYYGTGDTGGGPDSLSVAWVEKSLHGDGPLSVKAIGTDDMAALITPEQKARLPRYDGELLMTRHGVGCYTSQAAMKRWNRQNELLADAAERASVIAWHLGGAPYPREQIRAAWVRFLWHQFHDDLTGTSIPEAYAYSWNDEMLSLNQFASTLTSAVGAAAPALDTRVKGVPLVVFNPLSIVREEAVEATVYFGDRNPKAARVYGPGGIEVPSQVVERARDGLRIVFVAKAPSVGYAVYDVRPSSRPCEIPTKLSVTDSTLDNAWYRVAIDENGDISSVIDKAVGNELLSAPVRLQLLYNRPDAWAAWEIDYDEITAEPRAVVGGPVSVSIVENGAARVALEVTRRSGESEFRQTIRLAAGSAGGRVEIENDVHWLERKTLLKAAFFLTPAGSLVTYDLGLGSITRGVNQPDLYEVPGQQWADFSSADEGYGVAIMNDCKYGWDQPEPGTVRLTLIHTPGVPDSWAWIDDQRSQDVGRHQFTYAIQGHRGGWRDGLVQWEAARLNQPLLAFQTTQHKGKLGKSFSLLQVSTPHVAVKAVKLAEDSDEIVVRLQELRGHPADAVVTFDRAVVRARKVDGAEEPLGDVEVVDGVLRVSLSPYQPRAFAVTLKSAKAAFDPPVARPMELPFNLDGVSLDTGRRDGDFDGRGNTFSGDLLPDTLIWDGVPFAFGPTSPGAANVVSCSGQTIQLPSGRFDRLQLLAVATGGPAQGTFGVGRDNRETWIQDYAEPIAQWHDRLVTGEFKDENRMIAPAYINRAPVAWAGTHRHSTDGKNEPYQFTYLFLIDLPLPSGTESLTLPQNGRIKVMAATLIGGGETVTVVPSQPLYDVARATVTRIHAARTTFLDEINFEVSCPIPGAQIHYTIDGSEPTRLSPCYEGPVTVTQSSVVKSRAFADGAEDEFINEVAFERLEPVEAVEVEVGDLSPGLQGGYYEGVWGALPEFESLDAQRRYVAATPVIPEFAREEDYGLVFTGYVRIAQGGLYDFSIESDDGSKLFVAGLLVADNDGLHGAHEVTGPLALEAGHYPIAAYMFQRGGDEALRVSVQGPGIEKQPIPAVMLFHDASSTMNR